MKKLMLIVSALLLTVSLAACGNPSSSNQPAANTSTGTSPSGSGSTSAEPVNLTFWHAMSGTNEEVIKQVAATYNETIGKEKGITITPVFQGSYGDLMKKVRAAVQAKDFKNLPDLVQSPASDVAVMKSIPSIVWAQDLIGKDSSFQIDDLEPNAVQTFSFQNKIVGIPFANSTILLYYNKSMFADAGLDASKPPATIAELGEMAARLTDKPSKQWGFILTPELYQMSSWIGMQGGFLGNNESGRADTMTAVEFDKTGAMKNFLTEWKKAVDLGGVQTGADANVKEEFAAGKLAMFVDSTAALRGVLNSVGDKFEVGTAFYPKVNASDKGGVAVGGSALYVMDRGDQAKIDAAWDYIKYSSAPETQLIWHQGTGYFPVNRKTYDLPAMNEHLEKNPLFKTAIDQLHSSSPQVQEPMSAVNNEISTFLKEEILSFVLNKKDIDTAVSDMAAKANKALEEYNRANK